MITCNQCKVSFFVNADEIGRGRVVFCSNCHNKWLVTSSDIVIVRNDIDTKPITTIECCEPNTKDTHDLEDVNNDVPVQSEGKLNTDDQLESDSFDECRVYRTYNSESDNQYHGFSTITNHVVMEKSLDKHNAHRDVNIARHLILITLLFDIVLIGFIAGMIHIVPASDMQSIKKFYEFINLYPRNTFKLADTTITLIKNNDQDKKSSIDNNKMIMTLDLQIKNNAGKSDLLSDVKIVIMDARHNNLVESIVEPNIIVKTKDIVPLKIRLPAIDKEAEYISIYINDTIQIDQKYILSIMK